ncbi:outer membrane lipoprotein LolB [Massilia luteola]|jgi:outer membrane lipoprotein LolB|uniref:outer membrane lipoprotein LolB n=1 Tax=Massilia luteola TaxID=3081751 RepID=UPI002ACBF95B|nr:outer membrane lipoprotein LolB [Massilia sp. Gc5]
MPMHRLSRFACAVACAAALAGCATTSNVPLANPAAQVGAYRDTIDLNGRLAANYSKDGQPQSINGNFTWVQRPGRIDVSLFSPLGQTVAEITVTPGTATLTQSGRQPRVEKDIDTLTAKALGWTLPVSGLRDWLQGYAVAAGGKRFIASPAHDSVVTNDGWRLRFVEWQNGPQGAPMPRRIDAERSTTAVGDALTIRIVIDPVA